MRLNRFIGDFDLKQKEINITDTEKIRQMNSVLKLKMGESVVLCDGKGGEALCEITEIHKKGVNLVVKNFEQKGITHKKVSLFCALAKKDNFELIVQKVTELGVSEIVPIITGRTVKTGINMERLEKIAVEASEQSGRVDVPKIYEPISFENSLEMIGDFDMKILFEIGAQKFSEDDKKNTNLSAQADNIAIYIGPEGGWTDREKEVAKGYGVVERSLVSNTLRVETAGIVAVYECLK